MAERKALPRVGMNPSRGKFTDYKPARVTAAVLVHIPHFEGYYEHRMQVLKVCLGSLMEHTDLPFDLLVFDNGSCGEVRQYLNHLLGAGEIQYLIHSDINVGKIGAFQILFRAAPGEVVAYADDDIFFYPGWLQAHLRVLDAFPCVGMVTGCAVRTLFNEERISRNLEFAASNPEARLERGRFIEDDWMRDWAESYGRDFEAVQEETESVEDLIIEFQGLRAFAMANHNQFVAPKEAILACLPKEWSGRLMGEMDQLDVAVNHAGYLRLATEQRTTQHLGNLVSPGMAARLGIALQTTSEGTYRSGSARRWRRRFLRSRPVRWFLLGLYSRLFDLLNPQ